MIQEALVQNTKRRRYNFNWTHWLFLSDMLQNVMKAVTVPAVPLMMTVLLGLIIMYEYAVLGFYYFRHK